MMSPRMIMDTAVLVNGHTVVSSGHEEAIYYCCPEIIGVVDRWQGVPAVLCKHVVKAGPP